MHGGLSSSSPEELRREAEALLRSMGDITADTRARILGSSAPPDRLLALVRSAAALSRRRVPRRGGWIVNALKDEGYLAGRTMTPAAAADLVQRIRRDEVRPSALKGRAFDDRGLLRSKEWAEVVQRARAEGWGADTLERLIEFRPDDDLAVSTLVRGKDEAAILAALDAATGGNGGARGGGA